MAQLPAAPGASSVGSFTREDYSFLGLGNNATITTINQDDVTCIKSIGSSGNLASWYNWKFRFRLGEDPSNWTYDNGGFGGLKNSSNSTKHFYIRHLKAGDRLYLEVASDNGSSKGVFFNVGNTNTVALCAGTDGNGVPYPVSTTQTVTTTDGDGNTYTEEVTTPTPIEQWHRVTRDSWKAAEYQVDDITVDGKKGERFHFTSDGVLKDKRPAVPFLTVQFGSEDYKTYVQRYSGIVGAATSYNSSNDTYVTFSGGGDAAVPSGGSYIYFFPDVDGTLSFKGWLDGDGNDVYVVEKNADGSGTRTIADFKGNGAKDITGLSLTRGKIYFITSNSWAPSQHPIFHLSEFTFIPSETNYTGALSYVLTPAQKTTTINGGSVSLTLDKAYNTVVLKKVLGNIESANVTLSGNQLTVSNVTYKTTVDGKEANKGGVILACVNPLYDGNTISHKTPVIAITIPYGAEEYANKETKQIKVWDFYTNGLSLGKYSDQSSILYQEMHYSDGSADWERDDLNHYSNSEPVFKSVYDMEGDNADMIPDTEGLLFNTPTNNLCIYNENVPSGTFPDSYVGIRPGGKLTIPYLKKGDRVRMMIGRYGGPDVNQANAYLRLTNAKDVSLNVTDNANGTQTVTEGKLIEGDYVIGGTQNRKVTELDGDYNFIVDHDGNFVLEMTQGQLIKFYRIEIYRNERFITNNGILRNNWDGSENVYELVYRDEDSDGKILSYNLHNYGKGERIKVLNVDQITGNLTDLNSSSFIENNSGSATSVRYTTHKGQFGSFRLTLGVKTQNGTYITDRADRVMAIGYLQKMSYPYTWDFTILQSTKRINLTDYSDIDETDRYIENAIQGEEAASNIEVDNRHWIGTSATGGMRTGNEISYNTVDPAMGILFASGGQLYAQDKMFEETAGIGFKRNDGGNFERVKMLNKALAIADNGIRLRATQDPNVYFKMVIPKVPKDAVIYVKAQPIEDTSYPKTLCSTDGTTSRNFDKVITGVDDNKLSNVYIMKNDAERDVELWMNGLMIQKIGVSVKEDWKTIGSTGFVSESRNHKIDHSLTAEFTGLPIKAYIVTGIDDDADAAGNRGVEVREAGVLQENQGCFIANDMEAAYQEGENKSVNILGDGYTHLFVPAIHNMDEYSGYTNYMQPMINGGTIQQKSNGKINYALSSKHYSPSNPSQVVYGQVGFYRADKNKGATIPKNGAYLAVEEPVANNANAFYLRLEGTEEPLAEDFGDQDITAVKGIENAADIEGDWYNMNGQKLNGRPNTSGIYVVNGKKVVIK